MAKHKYKVSDIVEVFDDPISYENSQGKSIIVFVVPDTDHYYKVIFLYDEKAERVGRFIY